MPTRTADADTDTDADSDSDDPQTLDSEHSGWKIAGCWMNGCHSRAETHNEGMKPAECATCHGNNGAEPARHSQKCAGCHQAVPDRKPNDSGTSKTAPNCHGLAFTAALVFTCSILTRPETGQA